MESRRKKLTEFVLVAHGSQTRAGGEPYFNHLVRVADMVKEYPLLWEVGLCHDLLEDTSVDLHALVKKLLEFGYTEDESWEIGFNVWELTDEFTKVKYPTLVRSQRKRLEIERLSHVSWSAQTVKAADNIDNIQTSNELKTDFRELMLTEIELGLQKRTSGDRGLWAAAMTILRDTRKKLHENLEF